MGSKRNRKPIVKASSSHRPSKPVPAETIQAQAKRYSLKFLGGLRGFWNRIKENLFVQIFGGVVGGIAVLYFGAMFFSNSSPGVSRLPNKPLGSFLGFVLVQADRENDVEEEFEISGYELIIRSGPIDVNRRRAVVTSLEVVFVDGKHGPFPMRDLELAGDFATFGISKLDCTIRIDVVSNDRLIGKDQFIIAISAWPIDDGLSCPLRF